MPIERWVPLGIVQPPSCLEEALLPPMRHVADDAGWVHRICHHGAHRRSPHLAKQAVLRPARLGDHVTEQPCAEPRELDDASPDDVEGIL
eukprot:scaffold63256_cov73-Phaeocystis_antarctica.AAC.3